MPATTKVDNTKGAFAGKVALRLSAVEGLGAKRVRVLDAFAGTGRLWRTVARRFDGQLEVAGIDTRRVSRLTIKADNRRLLESVDLGRFDLIDLDSYGVPASQVETIARRGWHGPLIWTCITTMHGLLPDLVTAAEGIPGEWRDVSVALFGERNVDRLAERWCRYVSSVGWDHHGYVTTNDARSALYGISCAGPLPITRIQLLRNYNVDIA